MGIEQLHRRVALGQQLVVAVEIGERIGELGLVAIAGGHHLVELGLIGTRIDFGERVAGLYRLPFGEGDLGDLPLDLAAHDDGVVGNDGSDAAEIDRHIAAADGAGDDRNGEGRRRWRGGGLAGAPMREKEDATGREAGDHQRNENGNSSSHLPSSTPRDAVQPALT